MPISSPEDIRFTPDVMNDACLSGEESMALLFYQVNSAVMIDS
jgi:hypothetical protein